jgi:uncharacterized protein (TIGR02117 family)
VKKRTRQFIKGTLAVLAGLIAIPLLYFLAAAIGYWVPVNSDWVEPNDGVTIFVQTNGVHTWVMVPTVTPDMDWRPLARPEHIKDPRYAGNYIGFGFGNRDFYLNTPTWADLSVKTAAAALVGGGPSLMHVDHFWNPRPRDWQRPITLSRDQYRRLTRFLLASFDYRNGQWVPLIGRGYGPSDVFYESRRPYNFTRTCNEWTGEALRAAGVRTGAWTPLSQSIMWRLD